MKSILSPIIALLLLAGSAQAQQEFIRLNASGKSLNVERGTLELSDVKKKTTGAMWEKASVGNGLFVLRNRLNGQYLISSGRTLSTTDQAPSRQGSGPHYWRFIQLTIQPAQVLTSQSGDNTFQISPGAPSAVLQVEPVSEAQPQQPPTTVSYQLLVNTKQDPLHVENGAPTFSRMDPGLPGCMWEVKDSGNGFMMFTNRKSGQVLSSQGTTLITQAPGPVTTGQEPFYWRAVRNGEMLELTNSQGARLKAILQPVR